MCIVTSVSSSIKIFAATPRTNMPPHFTLHNCQILLDDSSRLQHPFQEKIPPQHAALTNATRPRDPRRHDSQTRHTTNRKAMTPCTLGSEHARALLVALAGDGCDGAASSLVAAAYVAYLCGSDGTADLSNACASLLGSLILCVLASLRRALSGDSEGFGLERGRDAWDTWCVAVHPFP